MPDICLIFEVHQPYRIRPILKASLTIDDYFDYELDREVMLRAARKCYIPATKIILEEAERFKGKFKVAFSISGVFIEHARKYCREFLDLVRKLVDRGYAELLCQTYYHSLASLFEDKSEFIEEIDMHRKLMAEEFGFTPNVFENTELIYNDEIAYIVNRLGFRGIITEGVERILGWRSPNYVYKAKGLPLRILFRNYRLSDDIAFRFSATWWSEYPLTADKYALWLSSTPGHVIVIFVDYETFGEHHWPESGIHEFLRWLPREVLKHPNLSFSTPSEVISKYDPVDEISVPRWHTISWADVERDVSAWLGNEMQVKCFKKLEELGWFIKELGDEDLLTYWRRLLVSDLLYYMSLKGGGPGLVHSYFSYFGKPLEAYTTFITVLLSLEREVKSRIMHKGAHILLRHLPDTLAFQFKNPDGSPLNIMAHSLEEFLTRLSEVPKESLRYHQRRGDFYRWISDVIWDEKLALTIREIDPEEKDLRKKLIECVEARIKQLRMLIFRSSGVS